MNDVKRFHPFDASVDGVLKLNKSIWVLIKQCKVRDCNLDIGTVIFKPDITDYPNTDDLLIMDNIPNDQKDLHFKGKVLAPNNPYIYYEDLLDITFNVTGADYFKDELPVYDDYESKLDFKHDLDRVGFNLDVLKVFAGKENISNLMIGRTLVDLNKNTDLYNSFVIVDDNLDIIRYLHIKDTSGLFLRSTRQITEFVWLSFTDINKLRYLSYCLIKTPDVLGSCAGIKLNNEFGAMISFIYDVSSGRSMCVCNYITSDLEFNNILSAIVDYREYKYFDSKLVSEYYKFEKDCFFDGCRSILCSYCIVAYDDILPPGVGVSPFNVILSEDFFEKDVVKRIWVGDTGIDIGNDDVNEFVVEDVDIKYDTKFTGKVVLKDGSIKQGINIEFDDHIGNVYPFMLELTQLSLVARHIRNNGYRVDFDKLSYDLGISRSLIYLVVDKFNHFYRDEEQQPVNLTYFDKGGKYLGDTQSEIVSLPSVLDIKSVDNGIDR